MTAPIEAEPTATGRDFAPSHLLEGVELPPPSLAYRAKCKVLGQPLHNEELEHERLGKPTALAVFASDNLSSSAYATEEILHVLIPAVGIAAFSLVVPLTVAMLVVLAFLILSYRETIKAYPSAGGAYIVTKDNFGLVPGLIAGVALLTDYVLTVAVSMSAGTAALASAFPSLTPYTVHISIAFITVIAIMNLRGVKESGSVFAVPVFFFIGMMFVLMVVGLFRMFTGGLEAQPIAQKGMIHAGEAGMGLFLGASLFKVLHAFASGGAAVTGVEAISNGVPAFKEPSWKHARETLVVMGTLLGAMFLGLSVLASKLHVSPYEEGTPTVISQIGKLVFGGGLVGSVLFYLLQAGTMLILVLAANTSFADFPRLASFQAGDKFLPRQLTKRGHRLVFSNGVITLSVGAMALVITTGAKVSHLIPLYAIGVFTGFTMSQSGMAKHHWRLREPGWKKGLAVNGFGALLSLVVAIVFGVTKFHDGAWKIIVAIPILVVLLLRLSKQYTAEEEELEADVPAAAAAKPLRRHHALVLVDRLDVASARAIQYARNLDPNELRAVHFILDPVVADELHEAWVRLGLERVTLELRDCPDRRLERSAVELVAEHLADGQTEVSVLLPERKYKGAWHRILHDRTGDAVEREVSKLAHVNVTRVPYHLGAEASWRDRKVIRSIGAVARGDRAMRDAGVDTDTKGVNEDLGEVIRLDGSTPINQLKWRMHARVTGRVRSVHVQPLAGTPTLECTLVDGTGRINVVFFGRTAVAGIGPGATLTVEGRITEHRNKLALLNPTYQLISAQRRH